MNFEEWAPAYETILTDFGFDRAADERAFVVSPYEPLVTRPAQTFGQQRGHGS